jgi:hypothetical protein
LFCWLLVVVVVETMLVVFFCMCTACCLWPCLKETRHWHCRTPSLLNSNTRTRRVNLVCGAAQATAVACRTRVNYLVKKVPMQVRTSHQKNSENTWQGQWNTQSNFRNIRPLQRLFFADCCL